MINKYLSWFFLIFFVHSAIAMDSKEELRDQETGKVAPAECTEKEAERYVARCMSNCWEGSDSSDALARMRAVKQSCLNREILRCNEEKAHKEYQK